MENIFLKYFSQATRSINNDIADYLANKIVRRIITFDFSGEGIKIECIREQVFQSDCPSNKMSTDYLCRTKKRQQDAQICLFDFAAVWLI